MPMGAMGWMITMPMMIRSQRVRTRRSFTAGSLAIGPFEQQCPVPLRGTGRYKFKSDSRFKGDGKGNPEGAGFIR
jgi:hypothetical protein